MSIELGLIFLLMGMLIAFWLFRRRPDDSVIISDPELAIQDLLQAGRKLEAIKLYRSIYGVGLKEAKDAIEATYGEPAPVLTEDIDLKIGELLQKGQKIQAIKIYQTTYSLGLKKSKDAIDAIEKEL